MKTSIYKFVFKIVELVNNKENNNNNNILILIKYYFSKLSKKIKNKSYILFLLRIPKKANIIRI